MAVESPARTTSLRLFLSYTRQDREEAKALARGLERLGHHVWLDDRLSGGQPWWDEIVAQIRACDAMVIAVSPEVVDSTAVTAERDYAEALGKPLLPILIKPVSVDLLPPDLARLQFVDFTNPEPMTAFELGGALAALPPAPRLPESPPKVPPVPISYLSDLTARVHKGSLDLDEQLAIVARLRTAVRQSSDEASARQLLLALRRRDDLLHVAAREIDEILASTTAAPTEVSSTGGAAALPPPTPPTGGAPSSAKRPRSRSRTRLALGVGAALVALLLIGVGFIVLRGNGGSPTVTPPTTPAPQLDAEELVTEAQATLSLPSGQPYSAFSTVTDNTGAMSVDIPAEWRDVDRTDGVVASTNLQLFRSEWTQPGVKFGKLDSYVDPVHLDGILQEAAPSQCTPVTDGRYDDGVYTGFYEIMAGCGSTGTGAVLVLAADPSDEVVTFVEVDMTSNADFQALGKVLTSFLYIEPSSETAAA